MPILALRVIWRLFVNKSEHAQFSVTKKAASKKELGRGLKGRIRNHYCVRCYYDADGILRRDEVIHVYGVSPRKLLGDPR
jgi:hypothetical protein